MEGLWTSIVLVIVGWLLGVLSPAMIEIIRRQRDYPLLQQALRADLAELRLVLALNAIGLKTARGLLDRKLLEWQRDVLTSHRGKSDMTKMLETTNSMLGYSDADLSALAAFEAQKKVAIGHGLKKFAAPTVSAMIPTLWQLPRGLQLELLEINQALSHLNEEVEYAQYYFRLTFENLPSANHAIAKANLTSSYMNIADMATRLVDKIDHVSHL
jgi:hypothetical protein